MRDIYVGTVLYGFCGGYFGGASHEPKRVEAIGEDWVVAREVGTGLPVLATFADHVRLVTSLIEYTKEPLTI